MDVAGNLKSGHSAASGEMEMSDALGRISVPGNWIEEPHVEVAIEIRLPARMGEIIKRSRDLKHAVLLPATVRCELKAVQSNAIALEYERELKLPVYGRSLLSRQLASEDEIFGGGIDAITLERAERPGHVDHLKRYVVGFEVERKIAILSVECGGAIIEIESSVFDQDLARAQIEERADGRLTTLLWPEWTRLIRRAVAVHDEVELRPVNLKVAQRNMWSEEAEDAHLDAQTVDLGVGRIAGILSAMNDDPVSFAFEMKKPPMKRLNLRATAGGRFNLSDDALANEILERG